MVLNLPSRTCIANNTNSNNNVHNAMDIDDSSVSSTVTVDRFLPAKQQQHQDDVTSVATQRKVQKAVRFDMTKNICYDTTMSSSSISDDSSTSTASTNISDRWYSAQDYRDFKTVAQDASNQIIRIEARNRAPYSYQRVMEHTFTSCLLSTQECSSNSASVLPDSELIHLQRWLEVATSRCGLEKWSIRKIARDKSTRRRELNKTIQNIQCSLRSESMAINGTFVQPKYYTDETTADYIRVSCMNLTRPSRLYAQTLGMALAAAIQAESNKDIVMSSQPIV